MPYTAEISRSNPTAFLFLVDQSGSMDDKMPSGISKAQRVADVLNRTLFNLITRCTKSDGVRNYFDIGVIGYGGTGVYNGFQGALGSAIINPISAIETSPLRIDERKKRRTTARAASSSKQSSSRFGLSHAPLAVRRCARPLPKPPKNLSPGAMFIPIVTHLQFFT